MSRWGEGESRRGEGDGEGDGEKEVEEVPRARVVVSISEVVSITEGGPVPITCRLVGNIYN